MQAHYRTVVRLTERISETFLAEQDLNPLSRDYGGHVSADNRYSEPGQSASAVAVLAGLLCCPESKWYHSEELLSRAVLYCEHLLRSQHDDGTIDLRSTNFHDATMVGFSVQKLGYSYRLLRLFEKSWPPLMPLTAAVAQFLERGAQGMVAGGFHTPNHRWVMASGLSLLANILDDERLRNEAELYLGEGIDCTEAGEYTERSSGVYNVVNNRSLIIVAEELDKPQLLEHVRRNLTMMLNYVEPDGSLFTLNSQRQDAGSTTYPVNYYENYLLMAHHDRDETYAAMAEATLDLAVDGRAAFDGIGSVLTHYLLNNSLRTTDLATAQLPRSYRFENIESNIVRVRSGNTSLSLLAGHSLFMQYRVGRLAVGFKIAGTFYGSKGRFVPGSILPTERGYRLESCARWGYVRPLPGVQPSVDWERLPHGQREHTMVSDFAVGVDIAVSADEVVMDLKIDGTDGVLVKIEFLVTPGGWLETAGLRVPGTAGQTAVIKSGDAVYRLGADAVAINGGFAAHNSTTAMRGSEPQVPEVFSVYCTGYSPLARTVRLRSAGGPPTIGRYDA